MIICVFVFYPMLVGPTEGSLDGDVDGSLLGWLLGTTDG